MLKRVLYVIRKAEGRDNRDQSNPPAKMIMNPLLNKTRGIVERGVGGEWKLHNLKKVCRDEPPVSKSLTEGLIIFFLIKTMWSIAKEVCCTTTTYHHPLWISCLCFPSSETQAVCLASGDTVTYEDGECYALKFKSHWKVQIKTKSLHSVSHD